MPPHCDTMDGPVVKAAIKALDTENVELILPFVHKEGEEEIKKAFEKATKARKQGSDAKEVADMYFFDTVVRVHRAGEGAPFTGVKPAGLDVGPVIPLVEKAIETGSADEVSIFLCEAVRQEVKEKLDKVNELRTNAEKSVEDAREYTEAILGFQVYSHKLYKSIKADPHNEHG